MHQVSAQIIKVKTEEISLRETPGAGAPLVLFHGMMDSADSWDRLSKNISRPTIAFDLPGFGKSSLVGSEDIYRWAKIYLRALNQLGKEEFFLLGHSLGGALASAIANEAPGRVLGLLLVAPAGYASIPLSRIIAQKGVEDILEATAHRAMGFDPLVDILYREIFSYHKKLDSNIKVRLKEDRQKMIPAIKQGMHIISDLSKNTFQENRFKGPVYALWGDHDHLVSQEKSFEQMKKIFTNPELLLLNKTGHHPQEESFEEFRNWVMLKSGSTPKSI